MHVLLLEAVTYNGATVEAGEVIEVSERSAHALVNEGKAEPVEGTDSHQAAGNVGENGETGAGNTNTLTDGKEANTGDNNDDLPEIVRVTKALDDQYKRDEIAEAAKTVGVEFPYDAKKADIIAAVIEQGKAEALLK